jgi:hypothetical protein
VSYPDLVEPPPLAGCAQKFLGNIVAVAKAGQWKLSGQRNYYFSVEEVKRLKEPIPAIGGLGFWRVDIGIEQQIWNDIGEPIPMVRG